MVLTRSFESALYEYSAKNGLQRREDSGEKSQELPKSRSGGDWPLEKAKPST
jgi:hypothetical protein